MQHVHVEEIFYTILSVAGLIAVLALFDLYVIPKLEEGAKGDSALRRRIYVWWQEAHQRYFSMTVKIVRLCFLCCFAAFIAMIQGNLLGIFLESRSIDQFRSAFIPHERAVTKILQDPGITPNQKIDKLKDYFSRNELPGEIRIDKYGPTITVYAKIYSSYLEWDTKTMSWEIHRWD